jgi:hypothetical protein
MNMAMNPKVKAKWVAALRSGAYPQARGQLNGSQGWCCLGVLTDLAVESGIGHWDQGHFRNGVEFHSAILPESVRAWAGLPMRDFGANVGIDGMFVSLAEHNDDRGRTFVEIADAIESQL